VTALQLDRAVNPADDHHSRYGNILDKASQYFIRSLNDAHKKENGGPIDPFPIFFQGATVLAVTVLCGASVEEASTVLEGIPFPMKRIGEYVTFACWFERRKTLSHELIPGSATSMVTGVTFSPCSVGSRTRRCSERQPSSPNTVTKNSVGCWTEHARTPLTASTNLALLEPFSERTILDCLMMLSPASLTLWSLPVLVSAFPVLRLTVAHFPQDAHMPNTFLWGLGILASRKDIQEKALEAVLLQDKLGDAMNWDKDNYLTAFVKEIGRYFTTFRLAIPRETMSKDLFWKGHIIPVGTTVYTNTHAMNRGKNRPV